MKLYSWALPTFLLSLISQLAFGATLKGRQAEAQIPASQFRRRGYQSSVVLNGWVYIDGGEVGYDSGGSVTHQYVDSLLAIDLTTDWTNASVAIRSILKPDGCPDLVSGGLWSEPDSNILYTGFAGRVSTFNAKTYENGLWSFSPDSKGGGTWNDLSSDADWESVIRATSPLVASGAGAGYSLGGSDIDTASSASSPTRGMVKYNFTTKALTNETVQGISMAGENEMGRMHYVPTFGPQGVFIALGGDQVGKITPGSDDLLNMTYVQIYDPAKSQWYEQKTTGSIPKSRKEFCVTGAASTGETYEILVYAGWDGNLGPAAIPYDEAYVLTLPGFGWVKANYTAANPRHGLSCNAVGGGQVLIIGGVNTTQNGPGSLYNAVFDTQDQFTQGLAIFDMSSLSFQSSYTAGGEQFYSAARDVEEFYAVNPRTPNFSSPELEMLFEEVNTSLNNGSLSGQSPYGYNGSNSLSPSARVIAGGVVGGLIVLAVVAGTIAYFVCRRKRKAATVIRANPNIHEINGTKIHEADGVGLQKFEFDNHSSAQLVEAQPLHSSRSELPGSTPTRYELPS